MRAAALLGLLLLASCAAHSARDGGAPPRSPAPASFAAPPPPPAPASPAAEPSSPPSSTAPGARATEKKLDGKDKDSGAGDALSQALAELELWSRSVELSLSSCEMACRALGSMERAAKQVCVLSDDRQRCDDATRRLREARARVRASCGECRGGPTTEPDAPLR